MGIYTASPTSEEPEALMEDTRCGIRIPYSIRSEDFGGKGIFADAKISSGSLVWEYRGGVNVSEYSGDAAAAHLEKLSMGEAKIFLDTSYGLHG